jgi:hypothetical protein
VLSKKARDLSGCELNSCDDGYKPVICPSGQVSKNRLGRSSPRKKPAAFCGASFNSSDDAYKPVICPPDQVRKNPIMVWLVFSTTIISP